MVKKFFKRRTFKARTRDQSLGAAYRKIEQIEAHLDVLYAFVEEREEMLSNMERSQNSSVWRRIWREVMQGPEARRSRTGRSFKKQ